MVLSMASFGAGGKTEQQMRSVLHSPCNREVTKNGYQALIDTLNVSLTINFLFKLFKKKEITKNFIFAECKTSKPVGGK